MAKFFLFVFTILLSLSMGLFVGQNYLLDAEKPEDFVAKTVGTDLPQFNLKAKINDGFNKLKDKFFANDEAAIPQPKSNTNSESERKLKDSASENEMPKLSIKQEQTKNINNKNLNTMAKSAAIPVDQPTSDKPVKPNTKVKKSAEKPVKNVTEDSPVSSEVAEEGTRSGWVIQVAAFQELSDARKVEQSILDEGYPPYIYKAKINSKTWYRINVGPFATVTDATNFKQSQKVHIKFKGAFVRKL